MHFIKSIHAVDSHTMGEPTRVIVGGIPAVAVETGLVEVEEPYTYLVLESPAGLIKAKVEVKNGRAASVSIINVPSFVYREDLELEVPEIGKIRLNISFGRSFFALVDAKDLGIKVNRENIDGLKRIGVDRVGEFEAVVPEITGRAYISGFNHLVIDPDDPLKNGFRL